MSCWLIRFIIVGLAVAFFEGTVPAAAPKPGRPNREKQDAARTQAAERDVKAAREKLNEGSDRLAKARRELGDAERDHAEHVKATQDLRERVEARHKSRLKLDTALAYLAQAQADFDRIAQPILDKLHQQSVYAEAVAAANVARAELRAAQSNRADGEPQLVELQKKLLVPSQLEQEALRAEPALEPVRIKLNDARSQVANLQKQLADAVESDPELKLSVEELQRFKQRIAGAKERLANQQQAVNSAQQKLAKEQADVLRTKAQDRANDKRKR